MFNEFVGWLIAAIGGLTTTIAFLYKSKDTAQEKLKAEHAATIALMMSDLKAERAVCQKENELMRETIDKLTDKFIALTKEHSEIKGRLAAYQELKVYRPHNERKGDKSDDSKPV
jgi:hypothetical protein